jgi:hypothetical protein
MSTHPVEILISKILIKPEYYPRFQTYPERIKEFVEDMECGETFPPVKLAKDEATGFYVLLDGKHRIEAYKLRGVDKILAFILPVKKEHWLMTAARFNSKSSKPLTPEEIKQIIIRSWENGIKNTDEIAREMGRTVRYVEMLLKPIRDEERNKREVKIMELHRHGISQRKIASETGLSKSYINRALTSNEGHDHGASKQQNDPIPGSTDKSPKTDQVLTTRNDFVSRTPDEKHRINKLINSSEKSESEDPKSKPQIEIHPKPDGNGDNEFTKTQIEFISGGLDEKPSTNLVSQKRNDFVSGTPEGSNQIKQLDILPENSAFRGRNETSVDAPHPETPEKNTNENDKQTGSDSNEPDTSIKSNKMFTKLNDLVLRIPGRSNEIDDLGKSPEKGKPGTTIQADPAPSCKDNHFAKKLTQYPSYLDQIDFYREFPIQGQHVMRTMELAKKYKLDIIDIVDEVNEPPQWVRKVLIAAIALSLMNGKRLDKASRVETLLGINFDITRYIQNALPFHRMLCPISQEMEHWFKDNLTANDLDLIAELSEADRRDLPYFLKGETPPPKTPCFKQLPGSYKMHFQKSAEVLNEICDHARNKMFNHDSAKELLIQLNIHQTAMNEIFDALREGIML